MLGTRPQAGACPRVILDVMLRASACSLVTVVAFAALPACNRTSSRAELHGTVRTATGEPVADALVAANRPGEALGRFVVTKADGSFELSLEKNSPFALTATSEAGTAAYQSPESFTSARPAVTLTLGQPESGFLVEGHVVAAGPIPRDVTVSVGSGGGGGDIFVTRIDATARYRIRLPRASARAYTFRPRAEGLEGLPSTIRELRDQTVDLHLHVPAPLPSAVTDWVRESAIVLKSVEAGNGFEDLAPVGQLVDDARIVALGEATHGTREFFQLKHRLFEYLVTKKGFRGIAIEASGPEARRLNEYVVHGKGSVADALTGLGYWTWDTQEVRSMIDWMRALNAEPKRSKKVEFFGFDMEFTSLAATNVKSYLDEVDPDFARSHAADLMMFADPNVAERWVKLSLEQRASLRIAADALVTQLDEQRSTYAKAMRRGDAEWRVARADARVLAQWAEVHAHDTKPGDYDNSLRDIAMMENVDAILADGAPEDKLVLWAHNWHVGMEVPPLTSMGELLRKKHGPKYVGIGLLFGEGGFQAHGVPSSPRGNALQNFELGLPPESDGTAPMSRCGHPIAIVDLRRAPRGIVRDWFASPHPVRDIGTHFSDETGATSLQILPRRYDAIAFVAKTTPARPNASRAHAP